MILKLREPHFPAARSVLITEVSPWARHRTRHSTNMVSSKFSQSPWEQERKRFNQMPMNAFSNISPYKPLTGKKKARGTII